VSEARTAGVTAIQRFGGAINLNVHFHTLVADGVFDLTGDGPARFIALPPPDDGEVARILASVIRKVEREVGRLDAEAFADEDALAALQAREVERRMRFPDPFKHPRRSAHLDGYSLHAGVRIHANDREGRERLCRYAVRPPFALDRLSLGEEGWLIYRMKRPRGEALYLLLTPDELLARLATLVPPPRSHALRYHGLFAPNAKHRGRVVPSGAGRRRPWCGPSDHPPAPLPGPQARRPDPALQVTDPPFADATERAPPVVAGPRYRVPWAELLQKVFALDVLECPRCAGRLEVIAYIAEPTVARRILDHLGLASQGPPLARARSPDDGFDPGPDYGEPDPNVED
jgi:hypothetical protein